MGPFLNPFRGSFSAVSSPIFASKVAFFSVFRALHFFLRTIPDFSDFSGPLHHFSQNLTQFSLNFKRDSRFCKSLSKFHRISSEFFEKSKCKKVSEFLRNPSVKKHNEKPPGNRNRKVKTWNYEKENKTLLHSGSPTRTTPLHRGTLSEASPNRISRNILKSWRS